MGTVVLLVGSFLYVWLRVEPQLEYHTYGPYFFGHWAFLEPFLGRAGGLACYAGVFLAQLNCSNWLGALVFVLSQCLILAAAIGCLARISGRAPGFGALIPLFVLLLLRNRYGCPVSALSVGLLLALGAGAAHVALPWRNAWWSTVASGLMSSLLFYPAGLWPALLCGVLGCLFGGIRMRNWVAGLGCLVLTLAVPLLALGTGAIELAGLLNPWPEGVNWPLAAALYVSVPVTAAVLALLPRPAPNSGTDPRREPQEGAANGATPKRSSQTAGAGLTLSLLAFLLAGAAVWLTFDRRQKLMAEIDYSASCGQYAAVVAAAGQTDALNHAARVRLQLALYHTGRLAEDMFSFLNTMGDVPSERTGEDWRAQSQPLFELGLINDAEHMAHEALETEGNRPDLLRLLARINRLKNRPQAAQVFLNVLSLIPFQDARPHPAWPTVEPLLPAAERAYLDQMRARVFTNDVPHDSAGPLLDLLLLARPTNQMAFEYAMIHHLINLDLRRAVDRLRFLDNFHYARIPRPYEEAVLLYQQLTGAPVDLKGRVISAATTARFRQFREASRQLQGSAAGPAVMAANFGDTYWFYYYANLIRKRAAEAQASAP